MISIDDFSKIEIRVGLVTEAVNKEGSEKLIKLTVDFGTNSDGDGENRGNLGDKEEKGEIKIIFTGVRRFGYTPEDFLNKKFLFVTNLEYRKMMDEESQGMILAVDGSESKPIFVETPNLPVGTRVR